MEETEKLYLGLHELPDFAQEIRKEPRPLPEKDIQHMASYLRAVNHCRQAVRDEWCEGEWFLMTSDPQDRNGIFVGRVGQYIKVAQHGKYVKVLAKFHDGIKVPGGDRISIFDFYQHAIKLTPDHPLVEKRRQHG